MRLNSVFIVLALPVYAVFAGCHHEGDAPMPGDGTFRAEKVRAEAARDVAERRCASQGPAAHEGCMTRAQAEYGRLVAAAELRRDTREADLPEIAKTR
ncbi:MAG: hypothetical protein K0Q76_1169 [Panacagrimonas sp.]|jgi:hypothetical protein|nr:hypothetical protein [Panacagrimonas sp.]